VVDERKKLTVALERISARVVSFVQNQLELVSGIRSRPIFANPFTIVDDRALEVSQLFLGIRTQTQNFVDKEQLLISGMRGQVRALSPKLTLERGYAVVRNLDGGVITDPKSAAKGQKLRVTLSKGDLGVTAD